MTAETTDPIRMGPALQAHIERAGGLFTLALAGEFDIVAVPEMESMLHRMEQVRPRRIVVDLKRLTFIDSTALQTLIAAKLRSQEAGHAFVVRDQEGIAARVIALAGVEHLLLTEPEAAGERSPSTTTAGPGGPAGSCA